ncbi:hypothetical protein BD413DRAFT_612544 [Trametes elegans]|nr:hypothetical protein BD413DRAFT_612544 [Trametes elegans]
MENAPSDVEMLRNDPAEPRSDPESASASASSRSSSPPPRPRQRTTPPSPSPTPTDPLSPTSPPPSIPPGSAAAPGAKPKSTKAAPPRAPSPSPPPPPARAPLQTIRLDIRLGGPEDYEVNVSELAKATGQRPATPVPEAKRDTSDESEGDNEGEEKDKLPEVQVKKRRKRRNHASEYYDTTDPFIDDSELAQDERTFFAQTKQKGFYVSSGQVALLNKAAPQRKPKSKKVNILAPSASVTAALSTATLPLPALSGSAGPSNGALSAKSRLKFEEGTSESPIALLSDTEDASGKLKRKMSETQSVASSTADGNVKKRRKTVEIQPFHPELEQAIDVLKEAIAKENWEVKGKFPPGLKPLLGQVALKAVILGEYDDNFFNLMPRLFPYNKFTMTKLIKRTIWRDHTNLLLDRQTALIEELRVLAHEGFPRAQEEWEKSVAQWEKRHARAEGGGAEPANGIAHSAEGSPAASDAQATPMLGDAALEARPSIDDAGGEQEEGGGAGGRGGAGKDAHPPAKRYRLTDQMKQIIWQLVCLSNECCRIENEKRNGGRAYSVLEGSNQIVSDQGVRKNLYQRIVAAFPEGWLSSGQISREVSVMKKKYEKESMEID